VRTWIVILVIVAGTVVVAGSAQDGGNIPVSVVGDWSSRHVIFAEAVSPELRGQVLSEPRFWQQFLRRHAIRPKPTVDEERERDGERRPDHDREGRRRRLSKRDWSVSLNRGSGGRISGPAKFVFDVTATPSCTSDFVVTGIQFAGSASQANILGLNNLYSNTSGTGFCAGTGPNVIFAYNVGTGTINSYITLSLNGQKLAFNEDGASGTSYFHVLTYKTGTGNGTSAASPAVPGTGNTAGDTKLPMSGTVTTAPFVDYQRDVAYVTTAAPGSSVMHKFSGVFNGTPAEVTTGGWPATIPGNPGISSPIFDGISRHVFVMDGAGFVDYVDDSVSPAKIVSGTFSVAPSGITAIPLIVDSSRQKIYVFTNNPNGTNAVVVQADTNLTAASKVTANIGSASSNLVLEGDFNNAYYTGGASTASFLYAVGNDASSLQRPALYNIGFNTSFTMNATTANGPTALSAGNTPRVYASPLTEFYNTALGKDFLFVGVNLACTTTTGANGCIRSLDITSGFPTAINTVILNATGGTGVITVDNDGAQAEASSAYFTTLTGATIVKATQAALN
jgi:hypothetical protein